MGFWMVGGELGRTLGPLVVVSALAVMSERSMVFLVLAGVATSLILQLRLRDACRCAAAVTGNRCHGAPRSMRCEG